VTGDRQVSSQLLTNGRGVVAVPITLGQCLSPWWALFWPDATADDLGQLSHSHSSMSSGSHVHRRTWHLNPDETKAETLVGRAHRMWQTTTFCSTLLLAHHTKWRFGTHPIIEIRTFFIRTLYKIFWLTSACLFIGVGVRGFLLMLAAGLRAA
jgi:hypothetical protein